MDFKSVMPSVLPVIAVLCAGAYAWQHHGVMVGLPFLLVGCVMGYEAFSQPVALPGWLVGAGAVLSVGLVLMMVFGLQVSTLTGVVLALAVVLVVVSFHSARSAGSSQ